MYQTQVEVHHENSNPQKRNSVTCELRKSPSLGNYYVFFAFLKIRIFFPLPTHIQLYQKDNLFSFLNQNSA